MRVLTKEWVDKAEGDFHTASRAARAGLPHWSEELLLSPSR
jgi:hypothetical protein